MNKTRISILKNSLQATLGLMLFGLGVHLVIRANIGAAPWDVLCIGLSNKLSILYGDTSIAISVMIIIADLLLGEKIGIGTILDAIIVGKTVDLLNWLNIVPLSSSLPVSLFMLLAGFFIEGFSQYLYMRSALSCGPRDAMQVGIGRRMPKIPIGVVNVIIQAIVLVIGYLLQGPIGIATLLAPLGIGLMQQLAFRAARFDPKAVQHQSLFSSIKVLTGSAKRNI